MRGGKSQKSGEQIQIIIWTNVRKDGGLGEQQHPKKRHTTQTRQKKRRRKKSEKPNYNINMC
jgi:hypothetical protein